MKDVTCGIVAMLICVAMISCDKKKKELKESVAKANQECPIDMGMIGSTTSISYDENSNELVYNLDMKEDFSNVKILSENPAMMKKSMMSTISTGSESFKKTIDSIIEVEGSLKFVLNGLKTGATAEIALNSEELKAAREMEVTPLSALETVIDITNLQMPIDNGQGMKTVALRLMGDNVTYICEMDPNLYNISRFESNRDLVKEEIIQFLRQLDSVEQIFFHQIITAEKNLAYLYCYEDGVDGDSFTIVVSKEELSELLE